MRKRQILVVEDEGIVAADITDRLHKLGYSVSAVLSSGEDALRKLSETTPDLVLMDIVLAGQIDGVGAAEQIRQQWDIPVVFLTAHADEPTLQRAKITAPFGYVLKPFDERELHTTIEIALYRHATEAKIKRLETWLAAVLESIGDAVVATDKWGLITFMNACASAFSGWTPIDAVGKPLTDAFPLLDQETRQPVDSPISKIVQEEAVLNWRTPLLLRARNGSEIPVDYTAAPIRDDQKNICGIVWVFRNIAARKQADAERARLIQELQSASARIKTLNGLLPICASCKKVRNDQGYWQQVEAYLQAYSEECLTHGLCPDCISENTALPS